MGPGVPELPPLPAAPVPALPESPPVPPPALAPAPVPPSPPTVPPLEPPVPPTVLPPPVAETAPVPPVAGMPPTPADEPDSSCGVSLLAEQFVNAKTRSAAVTCLMTRHSSNGYAFASFKLREFAFSNFGACGQRCFKYVVKFSERLRIGTRPCD